jgi:hypothetical protein
MTFGELSIGGCLTLDLVLDVAHFLDEVVILCGIDIFYMVCVEEDGCLHGCWIYLGGGVLGTRREGA